MSPPMWFDSAQTRCSSKYNKNIFLSIFTTCSSLQTGLPAGVYMLVRQNGSKAVLIVKAEPIEAMVRVYSDKQASTSVRPLTSANPTATAVRTVLPKIIKVSSSTKPSSSGSTCYGTMKGSGIKTLQRVVPQKYQTPLQVLFSELRMISSLDPLSLYLVVRSRHSSFNQSLTPSA